MRRDDPYTANLFDEPAGRPGEMGCAIEIAATMGEALDRAKRERGLSREEVASRMAWHLGEKFGVATLNGYCASSHEDREPSLRRAMAFDAALGADVLLGLYARKRGERMVLSSHDAALLEWARLHQQEKAISERKRALESAFNKGGL